MPEIKPCPFCGDEATVVVDCWCKGHDRLDYHVQVECKGCDAEVGYQHYSLREDIREPMKRAIETWNKRTITNL